MPKRTNLFQKVIEIIHRHMAKGATVESPAMLQSKSTGRGREVDVVIRGEQAGQDVIVSVEAVARSRKADREWVDQMVGKHVDLPTNKLVLVSEKGFTKDARDAAQFNGAATLAPEDLASDPDTLVDAIPILLPRFLMFVPESLSVEWTEPAPADGWDDPPIVALEDGQILGDLWEVVMQSLNENPLSVIEQLGIPQVTEDEVREVSVILEAQEGDVLGVPVDGGSQPIYLMNANGRGYPVSWVSAEGRLEIKGEQGAHDTATLRRNGSRVRLWRRPGRRPRCLIRRHRKRNGGRRHTDDPGSAREEVDRRPIRLLRPLRELSRTRRGRCSSTEAR